MSARQQSVRDFFEVETRISKLIFYQNVSKRRIREGEKVNFDAGVLQAKHISRKYCSKL